jgi:hypothetical protein
MAGVSSQGTTFTFNGTDYTVTSVQVDYGAERQVVSGAHMGLGPDDFEPVFTTGRTRDERPTVQIDFIGGAIPGINASGWLSVSGKLSFNGGATCISSQVTAAIGELVRGSASFRVEV